MNAMSKPPPDCSFLSTAKTNIFLSPNVKVGVLKNEFAITATIPTIITITSIMIILFRLFIFTSLSNIFTLL